MKIYNFGDPESDTLLIQMVDDHDLAMIEQEVRYIRELTGRSGFQLAAVKVGNWNRDLTPWTAPPVFGTEGFGDGAQGTLSYLTEELLPPAHFFIGGYSLAGLFALWAAYQTDIFDGVAAVSPSVWFPGFREYTRRRPIRTGAVYLSLGDKEEKARNRTMTQVGDAIREIACTLQDQNIPSVLEWNKGNHFKEPDLRTAKGFAWLINRTVSSDGR